MIKKSIISLFIGSLAFSNIMANEVPALPVEVFKVEKKDFKTVKTYPTILKAVEQVDIIARVQGTLKEKHFTEGSFVKKGTLLYKIEPDTYLANLNMKKANFIKAEKDFERAKSLIESKSISPQQFDDYTFQFESSKAALEEARIQFNYTSVKAPIDGIVGIKQQDIGDLVGTTPNNSLLVTITNNNPIHAEFSLPKNDMSNFLKQIKENKAKVAVVSDDKKYFGKIDFVSPTIDSNTDTLLLRAKIDNKDGELLVGNFSQIEISNLDLGDVFVIPEKAVLKTAQATVVMVADDNNIANPLPISIGNLIKEGVIVKGGLKGGEKIIISNIAKIRPNTKVQIVNKEK
ncbi:efflux RND transporter periplasmic adaptor subunit [Arcobacter porcinus]|uniref:RND family efflux system, membrane fusion protein n=1 Tax=Arcobacter porcinus TaxID=1935204 RepID=A0A5C2HDE5_9BACT|nr:efflux RND transporter periplasmic adaptor subunit [Arcobacter porcinus]OCL87132.1 Efflux pump periplasmic linker BepF [Aliarcobacter thereius]QEP40184.1 RND family efflux system, membrane fusion protein [Arcobacter porcinus]